MAVPCFYHEKVDAISFCAGCGRTICKECEELFLNLSSCPRCHEAVKALAYPKREIVAAAIEQISSTESLFFAKIDKVESSPLEIIELDPAALESAKPETETASEPPSVVASETLAEKPKQKQRQLLAIDHESTRYLVSLACGLIVGAIISLIIFQLLLLIRLDLSIFYIGMAFGIGKTVQLGFGKNTNEVATGSVVVMLLCLLFAHIAYTQDILNLQIHQHPDLAIPTLAQEFGRVMVSFNFMHWVFIFIGLIVCWFSATGLEAIRREMRI
jgi:hypothetical protein